MKWGNNRQSDQVEDRRSQPGAGLPTGGRRRTGGKGIGLGTIAIALVAGWIFGINPMTILGVLGGGGDLMAPAQTQSAPAATQKPTDDMGQFVAAVLGGTEDVWGEGFRQGGSEYRKPRLVLFRGATPTACGTGQSAMGPFYCPGDEKVYIDLSFYDTLKRELGAPGDFAQAYVIAHEVGHHVQNLLGITDKMDQMRGRVSQREYNGRYAFIDRFDRGRNFHLFLGGRFRLNPQRQFFHQWQFTCCNQPQCIDCGQLFCSGAHDRCGGQLF